MSKELKGVFEIAAGWTVCEHLRLSVPQTCQFIFILLAAAKSFRILRQDKDAVAILDTSGPNGGSAASDNELYQAGLRLLPKITKALETTEKSLRDLRRIRQPRVTHNEGNKLNNQGKNRSKPHPTDVLSKYIDWCHDHTTYLTSILGDCDTSWRLRSYFIDPQPAKLTSWKDHHGLERLKETLDAIGSFIQMIDGMDKLQTNLGISEWPFETDMGRSL
ncbi:hypothetical protein C8J56DRAFT_923277 [Mycena floridula]|nr:hypothetical protein C8J56DRAFT_923277 [Mycena floridula]